MKRKNNRIGRIGRIGKKKVSFLSSGKWSGWVKPLGKFFFFILSILPSCYFLK
jgi:hypothetical protein